MNISEAIIKCLEEEKVDTVFGYPGASILPVYESIRKSNIKDILVRNEQSAVHNANGYSRVTSKVGVCVVTSGPGATNTITGIATAQMDSIPLVIITGQVELDQIGGDVFQEADMIGSTEPFTKYNYLVKDKKDIGRIFKEAFHIAKTGRPGPVLIDIPVDIQNEKITDFKYPKSVDIKGYKPVFKGHPGQIKRVISRIKKSEKPVICVGGGVINAKAKLELKEIVDKLKIPVVSTLMGMGGISTKDKHYLGMVGSHGKPIANSVVHKSDLVIVVGSRVSDRSKLGNMSEGTDIIHIDIDSAEIGKNLSTDIPVVGDAKSILKEISSKMKSEDIDTSAWLDFIEIEKEKYIEDTVETAKVNPMEAMKFVSENSSNDMILVTDVGQNQFWAMRNVDIFDDRMVLASGGLGTMGYSLPAGIGAKTGKPDSQVVSVMGDGGIQMLIAELGVIWEKDLDIKVIVFNNSRLGMVRELQEKTYGKGNVSGVVFEKSPDFVKIAEGFGIKGKRVKNNEEFEKVFKEVVDKKEAFFIEALVEADFKTI